MTDAEMITMLKGLSDQQLSDLSIRLTREKEQRARARGATGELTEEERGMVTSGNLRDCVQSIRKRTGLGLRDAKDYMDRARFGP